MRNITLPTYSTDESKDILFTISNETFKQLIKEQGWRSKAEFMREYIYDITYQIYDRAKELNLIIREKEVQTALWSV